MGSDGVTTVQSNESTEVWATDHADDQLASHGLADTQGTRYVSV
jgi:hypothetical protein